jgi:hypothetical protein
MFDSKSFVRSHTFDDYSDRTIFSYPVRFALSTLKEIYQTASVELALPEPSQGSRSEHGQRRIVAEVLAGMEANWNDIMGDSLRAYYRKLFSGGSNFFPPQYAPGDLSPDGLITKMPPAAADRFLRERMIEQFSVVSHVPAGKPITDNKPDFDKLIDFHQALSSLNSYPALMRALGLVFDVDLPADFVATTGAGTLTICISDLPGHAWGLEGTEAPPGTVPLETAYIHVEGSAGGTRLFATAPGAFAGAGGPLEVFGLLNLDPGRYGVAQVDVDGGLHKNIILAETWKAGSREPSIPPHPEVFDPSATLPSLRSGGVSLFADARALRLLKTFKEQKGFNDAVEANSASQRPLYAEDLIHGYRLDIWDSLTEQWHSLHRRSSLFTIAAATFGPVIEEGFTQLAATQAAPDPANPPPNDLYLHEAVARWAGWSLSVPMPGKHLSSDADPEKALDNTKENEPATPFEMSTHFDVVKGTLPSLRFGRRYRLRARAVDICGNSVTLGEPITAALTSAGMALPRDPEGFVYLRYEPVAAPIVVIRDARAVTGPGSDVHRLVIRTFNRDPSKDLDAPDRTAADRHIVPPQTSVDTGERLGMFDDATGKLVSGEPMYKLVAERDAGELTKAKILVAGQEQETPLETGNDINPIPYLPDVLSRGAAMRDLPGTPDATIGKPDTAGALRYEVLNDPNPRPGSATLIPFGDGADWQTLRSFRVELDEGDAKPPAWNQGERVLTIFVPKGTMATIPLTSYMTRDDMKLMGVWQWLREYIDSITVEHPLVNVLEPRQEVDRIAHILQRSVEGGHWMLTPPTLLTLVHAVQQPIGLPSFTALSVQHEPYGTGKPDETIGADPNVLQTEPEKQPTVETELAAITAWRKPGSIDAYLMGGLSVHAASTSRVDIHATWQDPIDVAEPRSPDPQQNLESHSAHVDTLPISSVEEGFVDSAGRAVSYFNVEHDLLCFVRKGDQLGNLLSGTQTLLKDAAPRHQLNDTKHHRITYTATATSRYSEYFDPNEAGGFTRTSAPVVVDVPASTRPLAPSIVYAIPTFGWQRQTETNLKRSVRFGGGLRVYMERPWFSSGEGELLGVTLYSYDNGSSFDLDRWKAYVTQWGADPIWQTRGLVWDVPQLSDLAGAVAKEPFVSLEPPAPGLVEVAGYEVHFDQDRQLWYSDLTINTTTLTYAPFVRLALVRYQPHALPDSKLSRVVVADFVQLTPERSAVVTADPYHPTHLRVTVSGVAPTGPHPVAPGIPAEPVAKPTEVIVTVQRRNPVVPNELGWTDVPITVAAVHPQIEPTTPELVRWTGSVEFTKPVPAGQFRLLIQEFEYLSSTYSSEEPSTVAGRPVRRPPRRLIYAEAVELDAALVAPPPPNTHTKVEPG